jgi:hypothetical protein
MKMDDLLSGLPGEALVRQGVKDLQSGHRTIPACLVDIARTRLSRAGLLAVPAAPATLEPELELYRMLRREGGDAYSRYNALVRQLVSFESALELRKAKQSRP